MNTKKITLSFIAITLSLALIQFSLAPLAVAGRPHDQAIDPMVIFGAVIPSQSSDNSGESNYDGGFMIDIQTISNGQFTGTLTYLFYLVDDLGIPIVDENGDPIAAVLNGDFPIGTEITGTYKFSKHGLMLQFSGEGFSGQMKQDPRAPLEGAVLGFIHTPGFGYLSQVFVAGCVNDPSGACFPDI